MLTRRTLFTLLIVCFVFGFTVPVSAKTFVDNFMPHSGRPEICGVDPEKAITGIVEPAFNPTRDPERGLFVSVFDVVGVKCSVGSTGIHEAGMLLFVEHGIDSIAYSYGIVRLSIKPDGDLNSAFVVSGWQNLPNGLDDPQPIKEWCAFVEKEYPAEWNQYKEVCGELRDKPR